MKKITILFVVFMAMLLTGCGNSSPSLNDNKVDLSLIGFKVDYSTTIINRESNGSITIGKGEIVR